MEVVEVKHPNGYTGKLYGESSMSIYDSNGKEVMHTGFRNSNIKNADDLYKHLETFPEFWEMLHSPIMDDEEEEEFEWNKYYSDTRF